ncbi:MAG: hypothetical protein H0W04_01820 [Chthoniobacterales bacterium]|nr:hypothetical protein [Chthoniobacterales bacterium]
MKFSLSLGLLVTFAFVACEIDEPPVRTTRTVSRYPAPQTQYPPPPQPFGDPTLQPTPPPVTPYSDVDTASPPAPAPAPPTAKGDYPYGVPVEGKPGFVRSPFSPDKMTDVRGYAPGTEVKDPYTGKIFLVP